MNCEKKLGNTLKHMYTVVVGLLIFLMVLSFYLYISILSI